MELSSNKKWNIIFLALLGAMAFLYGYQHIFFMRPCSVHQWRQSDCLSITYNYYTEGMHFFSPAVNWCGVDGTGKSCTSECPLLYYLMACLWQIFGYHESIYRIVDTLIAFSGLYFLFRLTKEILQDGAWSVIVALLLFTSPIFTYYANNFTTDVPALSMALIAWYFFYKFYKEGSNRYFYKWLLFCALAGLTKISALISFVPVFLIFPIEALGLYRFKEEGKIFAKPRSQLLSLAGLVVIIFAWTCYAIGYNNLHFSRIFSTQTYPIWTLSGKDFHYILRVLYNSQLAAFISAPVFLLLLSLFLCLILVRKQVHKLLFIICCSVFAGCFIYLLLWFRVLDVHDYYLINLLIFIPFVLITFLHYLKKNQPAIFQSDAVKIIAGVVFVCNVYYCSVQMRLRYYPEASLAGSFVVDVGTQSYWAGVHKDYNNHFKALETITPYLRTLGLKRTDKVISLPDPSINISLYLMDQKGYTGYDIVHAWPEDMLEQVNKKYFYPFAIGNGDKRAQVRRFIDSGGVKYLVVNDSALLDSNWIKPFVARRLGQYKNVSIFDLTYKWKLKDTLNVIVNSIKHTPSWYDYIKKDAREKGITIDSALILNAKWVVQQKQFKL